MRPIPAAGQLLRILRMPKSNQWLLARSARVRETRAASTGAYFEEKTDARCQIQQKAAGRVSETV